MIAQLNHISQIRWQWMAGMFWQVSLFIVLITLLDMAIRRWAWPQVRRWRPHRKHIDAP